METWYGAKYYTNNIEEIEVLKSTPRQLVTEYTDWKGKTKQRRLAKSSWESKCFPSLKEAVAYKRQQLQHDINRSKTILEQAIKELKKFTEKYPE